MILCRYIHFVRKHLSPLVCTSKISVGHQSSAISPNFEECDIAADLISEWRKDDGYILITIVITTFLRAHSRE